MSTEHQPFLDREALAEALREWTVESGERLRAARKALGWTQSTLAQLAGTSTETVCRVELGAIAPRENLRISLAYAVQREVADVWPPLTRKHVHRVAADSIPVSAA